MKTIKILLLLLVFTLSSCNNESKPDEVYEVTYVIFYQNTVSDTVTATVKGYPKLRSSEGTNYIVIRPFGHILIESSAPIKIIKQTKIK